MPKNSSIAAPKYRHHKAKGLAVVTINGRDIYLGKYNTAASKELYRRLVAEYLQTGEQPGTNRQNDITIAEVLAAYIRHAREYYRKNGKPTK